MSSTILLIVLLSAHITGLISEQLLRAAVGGSVLIPCSLPGNPLTFYWKEDQSPYLLCHWDSGKTLPECDKYKGRFQVFNSEFSSGNISIRLDNISPEDDQKTFFAFVNFYDEQKKVAKPFEQWCRSILQVSAPYQNLVLTVNHTTNSATCSARGGYPAAQVSWKGLNRSSDKELDLQDAETFLQQDPTEKTFSITSSVNVTGLKSVTCIVYNPHSNKTRTRTMETNIGEAQQRSLWAAIVGLLLALILSAACVACKGARCSAGDAVEGTSPKKEPTLLTQNWSLRTARGHNDAPEENSDNGFSFCFHKLGHIRRVFSSTSQRSSLGLNSGLHGGQSFCESVSFTV